MKVDVKMADDAMAENIRFQMEGLLEQVANSKGADKYYAAATLSTMVEVLAKWESYIVGKNKLRGIG